LAEYARYEYQGEVLFRTVGFDFTFYRPPSREQLTHYASQLPEGFEACSKVWEEITIPRYAAHERYGEKAGQPNPAFLAAARFTEHVLAPYTDAFKAHTGPFIFEFQRSGIAPDEFLEKLDAFLGQLPKEFRYAVEVRNGRLLGPDYHALLLRHAVAHVYNHWSQMPPLAEQHKRLADRFTAPFVVMRLLTPLGTSYEHAVKIAEPYNKIVQALPQMREDTVKLARQAVAESRRAYVLVNNRSEGCAPLTIQALADELEGEKESELGSHDAD
jgi:uncharacterized protein YecE (DUF72 family)